MQNEALRKRRVFSSESEGRNGSKDGLMKEKKEERERRKGEIKAGRWIEGRKKRKKKQR